MIGDGNVNRVGLKYKMKYDILKKVFLMFKPFRRLEHQEYFFHMYENSPFCSEYPINM